jgi:hypothetical protein
VRSAGTTSMPPTERTSLQAGLNGAAGRTGAMGIVARSSGRDSLRQIEEGPSACGDGEGCPGGGRNLDAECRRSDCCVSRRRLDRLVLCAADQDLPIRRPW